MSRIFNRRHQKHVRQGLRARGTWAERILWERLRGGQLGGLKFRRQHGVLEFVVDFYCPELRLAIEIDGLSHDTPEAQIRDVLRERAVRSMDIAFFRVRDEAVNQDVDAVVGDLRAFIRALKASRMKRAG